MQNKTKQKTSNRKIQLITEKKKSINRNRDKNKIDDN